MDIIESLDHVALYKNMVLTLGNFDGLHQGHRELIRVTVETAKQIGGTAAAFTFDPHPSKVLRPQTKTEMLLNREQKIQFFARQGIQVLFIIPFQELAAKSPEEFVQEILVEKLHVSKVVIGYNFSFGYKGLGDPTMLVALTQKRDIETKVIDKVTVNGKDVSSTIIRALMQKGDLKQASELLGYRPFVQGKVLYGRKLGRTIGFPTANLSIDTEMVSPPNGVYAVTVLTENGKHYSGVANLGVKPTIGKNNPLNLEVHIFDFDRSIYGENLVVELVALIREEKKFASLDELQKQIRHDVLRAKEILKKNNLIEKK